MSVFNLIILSAATAAALVAWGHWRYVAWLSALVGSYALSVIYWDFKGPYAEVVAALCDGAIVSLVIWRARYIWELWFGLIFLTSMFVNMVYLSSNLIGGNVIDHVVYSSALEALNFIAISLVGGVAAFDKAGIINGLAFRPWVHFFGIVRPVYSRSKSGS